MRLRCAISPVKYLHSPMLAPKAKGLGAEEVLLFAKLATSPTIAMRSKSRFLQQVRDATRMRIIASFSLELEQPISKCCMPLKSLMIGLPAASLPSASGSCTVDSFHAEDCSSKSSGSGVGEVASGVVGSCCIKPFCLKGAATYVAAETSSAIRSLYLRWQLQSERLRPVNTALALFADILCLMIPVIDICQRYLWRLGENRGGRGAQQFTQYVIG